MAAFHSLCANHTAKECMMSASVRIAIVDDRADDAEDRRAAIEAKDDWPALVSTEVFSSADDLIDAFEKDNKFFDVILTDVFMAKRGDDSRKDSPDEGGIRIKEWLQ